ncbi:MAG: glycosyltransferase, partial [Patescibacteria group bacterium]
QSYPRENIEINVWDNNSTDSTIKIIEDLQFTIYNLQFHKFTFEKSKVNLGMWPAQEELLQHSHGEYIIVLSVDVILDLDFIKNAVEIMERDSQIGALQAKVYKYELVDEQPKKTDVIDTLGFEMFKSRRIVNIGHGRVDQEQYSVAREIFAVEGAVPVLSRQALEDCRLKSQDDRIVDPDFFWYGDDLDLAWRMRTFGWKQIYAPSVIAWHDRKTTKSLAGDWKNFIEIRKTVPMFKRRLDWRNTTLTIIKNDFAINLWGDLPHIFWRQVRLWAYFLIFEPTMLLELFKVAKMLPKMLKRRSEIMKKAKISAKDFRQWIH